MKIFQNKQYLWPGILLCGCVAFQAGAIDVSFQMTYTQPTCNLTFDNNKSSLEYPLGTISSGTLKDNYVPFTINVDCQGNRAVKTAIKAKVIPGGNGYNSVLQPGDESVRMQVAGAQGVDSNSPELWLLLAETGLPVKLAGQKSDAFCTREDTTAATPNTCKLKPVVKVPPQSPGGDFGTTIQFNVEYFL
ncbi:TPA: hypothetical protein ACISY6_004925 [Salmonella enterica subsp. enterica serovar Eastbourne]|nr:type 1 fimbrial protein [Salmonella enterica]